LKLLFKYVSICLCLAGQSDLPGTSVPSYQVFNLNQVQVGPTPCPGTCISQAQIQQITFTNNGLMPDGVTSENTGDAVGATCVTDIIGVTTYDYAQRNFPSVSCIVPQN